jgi:FtsZ-binding cell division protein ZapB
MQSCGGVMPKAEDYLYPNQMIVEIDDYDGLQAELDRLREENASLRQESVQYAQEADRLRAEKAELIEMLATRTTHPEYMEVLRRYKTVDEYQYGVPQTTDDGKPVEYHNVDVLGYSLTANDPEGK